MLKPASLIPLLLLLISAVLIKNSAPECTLILIPTNYTLCDSLGDLDLYDNLTTTVKIEGKNLTDFTAPKKPQNQQHITTLSMSYVLKSLSSDALQNFVNLETLTISINNIHEIKTGTFKNLTKLRTIILKDNDLQKLEPGAFQDLPNLENLLIRDRFDKLRSDVFFVLPALKMISVISYRGLKGRLTFWNLPNIEEIYLNLQMTNFFAQDYLNNTKTLTTLGLNNNFLTTLFSYMFEGLINLKVLDVSSNKISSIEPGTFAELPNLETLRIDYNELKILDANILPQRGLPKLTYLRIRNNKLMFLSSKFFFKMPALKTVSLGGNPWKCPCMELVLKWLYDQEIKNECDHDYFSANRATCVFDDSDSDPRNTCDYTYNENLVRYFKIDFRNTHLKVNVLC